MRCAGLLLAVSALPSRHGIGDFGSSCYELIDFMKESGLRVWQILPLNPLGYGNSPYQPYSSNAMDELYISLDGLVEMGLLKKVPSFNKQAKSVDYEAVRKFKKQYLLEAFENFKPTKEYNQFIQNNWVYLFGAFMTLKHKNGEVCWNEWKEEDKNWIYHQNDFSHPEITRGIAYEMFVQYILYKQWMDIKKYANQAKIKIVGDLPIYVGIDSVDVWANQANFLLDDKGRPTFIAGVPPDYFSATGQRWGNPIYNWDYMEQHGFDFWINRLKSNSSLFDMVRIDHFRAFDTYWKIPASCPTAIEGEWIEAPGYKFFDTINKEIPSLKIIAEDLGDLRDEVLELRDYYHLPGMKIVQFTFNSNGEEDFDNRENMIVYTGTHDNDTIRGWYSDMAPYEKVKIRRFFKKNHYLYDSIHENFIAFAFDSIADMAIIPAQDYIGLGHKGRINTPGTLGSPNWEWRLTSYKELFACKEFIKKELKRTKR